MAATSDLPSIDPVLGFRSQRTTGSIRKAPPTELTVKRCQGTPPGTGGNNLGQQARLQIPELHTPPNSDDEDSTWPRPRREGRNPPLDTKRLIATETGLELDGQKTAGTGRCEDTCAAELQHYLSAFRLTTTGDTRHSMSPVRHCQYEDKRLTTRPVSKHEPRKQVAPGTNHAAGGDSTASVAKCHNGVEKSVEGSIESPELLNGSRTWASDIQSQRPLEPIMTADYAYQGPFFVPNTSYSKMAHDPAGTTLNVQHNHSPAWKDPPSLAAPGHRNNTTNNIGSESTPAVQERQRKDTGLNTSFRLSCSSAAEDRNLGSDHPVRSIDEQEKRTHMMTHVPDRSVVGSLTAKQLTQTRLGGQEILETQKGVLRPIAVGAESFQPDQYDLRNPAVSAGLLRRPSMDQLTTETLPANIMKLSPEAEQRRIAQLWAFFAYLICNLRIEETIQEDQYQESALWRTCITLAKDNGSLGVFARMKDCTMVALGVPVSLISRVRKDLIVWTLAGRLCDAALDARRSGGTEDDDARSFVTWGSDDDCVLALKGSSDVARTTN